MIKESQYVASNSSQLNAFWNSVKVITRQLNDEAYQAEWKYELIENHKETFIKEIFTQESTGGSVDG